jgi:glycosyltransferase involved in cell wall biosynthesis
MRILFISKIKPGFEANLSPIVKSQGDSLIQLGHNVEYYIVGKGFYGYIKLLFNLSGYLKKNSFDIIHSHYSITSIITSLAIPRKKIVVSLMGSDTERKGIVLLLIRAFSTLFWKTIIVKTERMKNRFKIKNTIVLPNGVDFNRFVPISKDTAQCKVGFSTQNINILFLADSSRTEKNVTLARSAVKLLNNPNVILHEIYPIPQNLVPYYLNAADVLVLSSIYEGSVNIVKEAMACCTPIVSTDVGDVKENIISTKGCYIASHDPSDFSDKISQAIQFNSKTNGRDNIQHLNSSEIARRLVNIYSLQLNNTANA